MDFGHSAGESTEQAGADSAGKPQNLDSAALPQLPKGGNVAKKLDNLDVACVLVELKFDHEPVDTPAMTSIQDLHIGTRLSLAFGTLLLLGVAAFGSIHVDRARDKVEKMYEENLVRLQSLAGVKVLILRNRVLVMEMMAHAEPANIEKRDAELRANLDKVTKALAGLLSGEHARAGETEVGELARVRVAYVSEGLLPARDAVRAGQLEEAKRIYGEKVGPLAAAIQVTLDKLMQRQVDTAAAALADAAHIENAVYVGTAMLAMIALLLGACLVWASTRSITRPAAGSVRVAQGMAVDGPSCAMQVGTKEEVARLLSALVQMQAELANVVGTAHEDAGSVTATTGTQTAQGKLDPGQRTQAQADVLPETAAPPAQFRRSV